MSQILLTLENRHILNTGDVVLLENALIEMARDGLSFHNYLVENSDEIQKYNKFSKNKLQIYEENDDKPSFNYERNTSEEYKKIDMYEYCSEKLEQLNLCNDEYIERLSYELQRMEELNMFPLLRHIIFMIDHFKKNNVVWGVGRGSSCASLVLFLIGLNYIDPVKFDIPINEFLK